MGKRVYSEQFKNAAVDHVIAQRQTMSSVAKRLNVDYHTLRGWVLAAKSGSASSTVPASLPAEQRIRELEKEVSVRESTSPNRVCQLRNGLQSLAHATNPYRRGEPPRDRSLAD
ncbi:MAG: transposase [Planctomycetota bacterium]|nr:transposase [Planctomycetota bacterium]